MPETTWSQPALDIRGELMPYLTVSWQAPLASPARQQPNAEARFLFAHTWEHLGECARDAPVYLKLEDEAVHSHFQAVVHSYPTSDLVCAKQQCRS